MLSTSDVGWSVGIEAVVFGPGVAGVETSSIVSSCSILYLLRQMICFVFCFCFFS
jgi:hypothetical protein